MTKPNEPSKAGAGGQQEPPHFFGADELQALYATISAEQGIDVSELRVRIDELLARPRTAADLQAYREGKKPWKKLADEVLPVVRFLNAVGAEGRVRFPLDDQPPDAWLSPAGGHEQEGIEVTRARGRSRVELAKDLRGVQVGRGFEALPATATQKDFDAARARGRITHTRREVETVIEADVAERLKAKSGPEFDGFTLLVVAPLGSAPAHDWSGIADRLAKVEQTHFKRVFLIGDTGQEPLLVPVVDKTPPAQG